MERGTDQNVLHEQWLNAAKAGDSAAFDLLLDALLPVMFRQAMRVLGNESDAEDIVQDASLKIFRSIRQFRGNASVQTWATRITLNCCYDFFRRQKNRRHVSLSVDTDEGSLERILPDERATPLDAVITNETVNAVREAALSLREPYRTTLIQIDLLQMSYEETAIAAGVAVGTIKSRLSRARSMAGAILKKQFGTK
ncbi:MAG TPA: RNA polymerase sigma factor [Clostridiaceae bacterium]|jgi:RNA polymerase sigma-70 factor (ECF subfamily)|nr:RNA polymerase sigma factor [Clostridiaceae bacterium]